MLAPEEVAEDVVFGRGNDLSCSVYHVELALTNGPSLRGRISMSDVQWIRLIRITEAA